MTSDETSLSLNRYKDGSGGKYEENEVEIEDILVNARSQGGREETRHLLWRKRLNTLFVGLAFTCLGITYSVLGPAFLDLLQIIHVSIERGAIIFTSASIGYLTGSLVCGFTFEKVNQDILLFVSTIGTGIFVIIQPWIPNLPGMALIGGIAAFCAGGLDTALNTVCMLIWGVQAGPYMQAVHFLFAIGGLLAPLIVEPFLMEKSNTNITAIGTNSSNLINNSTDRRRYDQFDSVNTTLSEESETRVQFALLICGLITVIISFVFIYTYFVNKRQDKWNRNSQANQDGEELKLTRSSKIVYLVLLAMFFLVYTSVEDTFMTFLAAFVVKYADWSKSDGAKVVAVYWGSYAGSRLLSVFIAKFLSPWKMLLLDFVFLLITLILLCFLTHITAVLWVAPALVGLSIASIFPTAFIWTEMNIMNVNGRIASLFLISGGVGTVINPLIIGYLFEHYTPLWFVWLLLGECILNVLIFIVITILTNCNYGRVSAVGRPDQVVKQSLIENRSTDGCGAFIRVHGVLSSVRGFLFGVWVPTDDRVL